MLGENAFSDQVEYHFHDKCDFVTTTPTPGEASGLPAKTAACREFCG